LADDSTDALLYLTLEDLLGQLLKASLQSAEFRDRSSTTATPATPRGPSATLLFIFWVMVKAP